MPPLVLPQPSRSTSLSARLLCPYRLGLPLCEYKRPGTVGSSRQGSFFFQAVPCSMGDLSSPTPASARSKESEPVDHQGVQGPVFFLAAAAPSTGPRAGQVPSTGLFT